MAKSFAKLMARPDIRSLVKSEVGKQFDGDYEVLFKTLLQSKTTGGQPFCSAIAESYQLSCRNNASMREIEQEMLKIAAKIPRFQVAVPHSVFKVWDDKTIPLVAYKPIGVRDRDLREVKAFDANGNLFWLNVKEWNAAAQPLIVLGINERTDDAGNLLPGLISGRTGKFIRREDRDGNHRLLIEDGGGLPPDPTLYRFLYVREFKCNDPWWDPFESDPEFFVEVNGSRTDFYEINGYETRIYNPAKVVYSASAATNPPLFITVKEQDWWLFFTTAEDVALNWHYPGSTASVNGFIFSSLVNPIRILDNTGTIDQVELVIFSNF